jgi:hypothetical protein
MPAASKKDRIINFLVDFIPRLPGRLPANGIQLVPSPPSDFDDHSIGGTNYHLVGAFNPPLTHAYFVGARGSKHSNFPSIDLNQAGPQRTLNFYPFPFNHQGIAGHLSTTDKNDHFPSTKRLQSLKFHPKSTDRKGKKSQEKQEANQYLVVSSKHSFNLKFFNGTARALDRPKFNIGVWG